jgi:pentatricopeptide repeat protein
LNAAQLGQIDKAEQIINQMFDADLSPGPRAFHVLVFAYVKGKKPQEALAVARRASDDGKAL